IGRGDGTQGGRGLGLGLAVLHGGVRVGHHTPAGLHVSGAVLEAGGADGDGRVHVNGEVDVADRVPVDAALYRLEPVDDPHRGGLRRPGEGAGGEGGTQRVVGGGSLPQVPRHRRNNVLDVREALYVHEIADHHRAGVAELLQIVAGQVYQHQVLGALL